MIDTASKNNLPTLDILSPDTLKFFVESCKDSVNSAVYLDL